MERAEKSEFSIISFVVMWTILILSGNYLWNGLEFRNWFITEEQKIILAENIPTEILAWNEKLNSSTPIGVENISTPTPIMEVLENVTTTPIYIATPENISLQSDSDLDGQRDNIESQGKSQEIKAFAYSYYYPALGPPNCFGNNWIDGKCLDMTGIGEKWSIWLDNFGAGCPISDFQKGDKFEVLYPPEIQGIYTCVDICIGCNRSDTPTVWIDFLHSYRRLVWGYPVAVRMLDEKYPYDYEKYGQ